MMVYGISQILIKINAASLIVRRLYISYAIKYRCIILQKLCLRNFASSATPSER